MGDGGESDGGGTGGPDSVGTGGVDGPDDRGDETVRCWLVDRQSRDENLVTLVYATTDGQWHLRKQLSFQLLTRNPVTAARDVEREKLEQVPDPEDRERFGTQARAMAAEHDPDDEV